MKALLLVAAIFNSSMAFAVGFYECTGGPYALEIAVRSQDQLIINDFEVGEIDRAYARSHPQSKTYRLLGEFDSLGGGQVFVSKSIFNGARTARVTRIRRGGDGVVVTDNYRCVR